MEDKYLRERNSRLIDRIESLLFKAITISFLLGGLEVAVVGMATGSPRTEVSVFKMVLVGFFAICIYLIWLGMRKSMKRELLFYKNYIDCIIEQTKQEAISAVELYQKTQADNFEFAKKERRKKNE